MNPTITQRTYTRVAGEQEQTITVNIGPDGYVRLTAAHLEHLLHSLGFTPTEPKD